MREDIGEFKMTRNEWIHRECETESDTIVLPFQTWQGGVCYRCGEIFGVVWQNEVVAVEVPEKPLEAVEALREALEIAKAVPVANVVSDTSGGEVELPKPPEAETVEAIKETLDIIEDPEYEDLLPEGTDKEAEIAALKAKLEALEAE